MDNPTIGDYTKGISKDTVGYFRNLQREAGRLEHLAAFDLGNPLFAMIRGPVDPLNLDAKGRLKPDGQDRLAQLDIVNNVKNVDKSVEKRVLQVRPKWSKGVGLADLREAIGTVGLKSQCAEGKIRK